jgi:hypothetical protein
MDAIGSKLSSRFRQERNPKRHSVFRHPQRRGGDGLAPNGNGRALQATMNALVIALDNLNGKIGFKLMQG